MISLQDCRVLEVVGASVAHTYHVQGCTAIDTALCIGGWALAGLGSRLIGIWRGFYDHGGNLDSQAQPVRREE